MDLHHFIGVIPLPLRLNPSGQVQPVAVGHISVTVLPTVWAVMATAAGAFTVATWGAVPLPAYFPPFSATITIYLDLPFRLPGRSPFL